MDERRRRVQEYHIYMKCDRGTPMELLAQQNGNKAATIKATIVPVTYMSPQTMENGPNIRQHVRYNGIKLEVASPLGRLASDISDCSPRTSKT
jgi:hypothetical protein